MNFKQCVVFCCLVLCYIVAICSICWLTLAKKTRKNCESLCQYIEHLCLQKLSLLGTQIFRRKNLKRNQFFQRTTFQFLMHDSLLPRKRLLEFLFFKKKFTFSKSVIVTLYFYHINFRKQKRTKNCENRNNYLELCM